MGISQNFYLKQQRNQKIDFWRWSHHSTKQYLHASKFLMLLLAAADKLDFSSSKKNDKYSFFFPKGFALKNMDYTYVKRLIWIMQNCYPERLGVCLIVNSPWIFYGCWSIIKFWLVNLRSHFASQYSLGISTGAPLSFQLCQYLAC